VPRSVVAVVPPLGLGHPPAASCQLKPRRYIAIPTNPGVTTAQVLRAARRTPAQDTGGFIDHGADRTTPTQLQPIPSHLRWPSFANIDSNWLRPAERVLNSPDPATPSAAVPFVPTPQIGSLMIVLGIILLLIGYFTSLSILYTIGGILVVIGIVLWILGAVGRPVGGRKVWF
jgi:hypothetical protein